MVTPERHRRSGARAAMRFVVAGLACSLLSFGGASAYIGDSFVAIPGIVGGGSGKSYDKWLKIEAHYWRSTDEGGIFNQRRGGRLGRSKLFFSYPTAPRSGADQLVIAIDKRNPRLRQIMESCAKKARMPELTFAENAVRSRFLAELGPRPSEVPAYFEYRLKDVVIADCPVVADAPEQAFVLAFSDIQWLNAQAGTNSEPVYGTEVKLLPASLAPIPSSGATKSFVLSWFAVANDVSDDQCPKMNVKPAESDYYALMPKEEADKVRAELSTKGGVNYENGQMGRRGPNKLNACLLPGIVRDPGHVAPVSKIARGLDLDGNDGTGKAPAGVCRHRNYTSDDGRSGIDNQLYSVLGCAAGYQGHKGFLMQYRNEQRRNGLLAILVQISGIDDEKNDDNVDVTILYSKDPMAKNASGSQVLPDYTFRLSDNAEFAHYNTRLRGRIVDGVIVTDPVQQFQMHLGIDPELTLHDARMRLKIQPDGSLKGVVGGYEDWRRFMALNSNSNSENLYGFQCPGLYHALKRAADGMKDSATGECNGISVAYDLEGSRAFIPPGQHRALIAQADGNGQKVR